jgi:hypothetical protein
MWVGVWVGQMLSAMKLKTNKPGRYADIGGLYLQVSPGGSKSWLYRFRWGMTKSGKPATREMGLGSLADVSWDAARELAQQSRKLVKAGIDPIAHRRIAVQDSAADGAIDWLSRTGGNRSATTPCQCSERCRLTR